MSEFRTNDDEHKKRNEEKNELIDEAFFNAAFNDLAKYEKLRERVYSDQGDQEVTPIEVATYYAALIMHSEAFNKSRDLNQELKTYEREFSPEIDEYVFDEQTGLINRLSAGEDNNVDLYLASKMVKGTSLINAVGQRASDKSPIMAWAYSDRRETPLEDAIKKYASKNHGVEITINSNQERNSAAAILLGDVLDNDDFFELLQLDFKAVDPDTFKTKLRDSAIKQFMDLCGKKDSESFGELPSDTTGLYEKFEEFLSDKDKFFKQKTKIAKKVLDQTDKDLLIAKINPLQRSRSWMRSNETRLGEQEVIERFQREHILSNNFYKKCLDGEYDYISLLENELQAESPNEEKLCNFWALAVNLYGTEGYEASELKSMRHQVADIVEPYLTLKSAKLSRLQIGLAPMSQLQICADALRPEREDFWLITDRGEPVGRDQDAFAMGFRATFGKRARFDKHLVHLRLRIEMELDERLERGKFGSPEQRELIYANRLMHLISEDDRPPNPRYEEEEELFRALIEQGYAVPSKKRGFGGSILNITNRRR